MSVNIICVILVNYKLYLSSEEDEGSSTVAVSLAHHPKAIRVPAAPAVAPGKEQLSCCGSPCHVSSHTTEY